MGRTKPSTVGNVEVSPVPLVDRVQAAAYVAALTGELASLVRRHRLDTLGYFLDMARLEAEEVLQQAEAASGSSQEASDQDRLKQR